LDLKPKKGEIMSARNQVCSKCGQTVNIPDTIGGRIQMKRIERDKSRAELGGAIGRSGAHIATIEKGTADIRFGDLKALSRYLATDLNFFIGE
jgi:hypothetical protein